MFFDNRSFYRGIMLLWWSFFFVVLLITMNLGISWLKRSLYEHQKGQTNATVTHALHKIYMLRCLASPLLIVASAADVLFGLKLVEDQSSLRPPNSEKYEFTSLFLWLQLVGMSIVLWYSWRQTVYDKREHSSSRSSRGPSVARSSSLVNGINATHPGTARQCSFSEAGGNNSIREAPVPSRDTSVDTTSVNDSNCVSRSRQESPQEPAGGPQLTAVQKLYTYHGHLFEEPEAEAADDHRGSYFATNNVLDVEMGTISRVTILR